MLQIPMTPRFLWLSDHLVKMFVKQLSVHLPLYRLGISTAYITAYVGLGCG